MIGCPSVQTWIALRSCSVEIAAGKTIGPARRIPNMDDGGQWFGREPGPGCGEPQRSLRFRDS